MNLITFFCHPDLENWNGTDRHHFNAIVADQDLVEVHTHIHDISVHSLDY